MVFKIEDTNKEREINEQKVKRKLTEITKDNLAWFILGWIVGIVMSIALGLI